MWRTVMHRAIGSVTLAVLTLMWCSIGMAQGAASSPSSCHSAPTRACLLDEALMLALSAAPSTNRAFLLGSIAEAQATAGNLQKVLQIAEAIPSDQASRVSAFRALASAQARVGLMTEARETFSQARQLAGSLDDLSRAEALKSIAQAQADAGMTVEATDMFEAALGLAKALEISARLPCIVFPSAEFRRDGLFKTLAEREARAGVISDSLQTARLIKYQPHLRAGVL